MLRLTKSTTLQTLAQCDSKAVSLFVESGGRPAESVLRPISDRLFQKKLQTSEDWRSCFDSLCQTYAACKKKFIFRHDRYDGYCLVYQGEQTVLAGEVFRAAPVGFLREIDSNITDLSVIIRSSSEKENLMLGPTRFVNSDCHPNCDYDFTSDADIVRIRALRSIRSGDEITVKYGEAFFDSKECLRKTCLEKDPIIGEGDPILRNSSQNHGAFLPDTLTEPKQLPVVSSSRAAKLSPPAKKSFSLLQKLKYYEETDYVFEDYPSISNNTLNGCDSSIDFDESLVGGSNESLEENLDKAEDREPLELGTISIPPSLVDFEIDATSHPQLVSPIVSSPKLLPVLVSQNSTNVFPSFASSTIEGHAISFQPKPTPYQPVYDGATFGVGNAVTTVEAFCSRFRLSDHASHTLIQVLNGFLPEENLLPTPHSHVYQMKKNFKEGTR